MNVLITGSSGFIGRAVGKKLDLHDIPWSPFVGDVLRAKDFQKYEHCDIILHLAGVNRTGSSYQEQKHLLDVNILGTFNAISFAQSEGKRLLFLSTCGIYDSRANVPICEAESITYHDAYSYSKWIAEQAMSASHKLFGLKRSVIFRGFNVYGPDQPMEFLIPDIVHMVPKGRLDIQNLDSVRDFIYINDLAELIYLAVIKPISGLPVINAGSGLGYSVNDVLQVIFELLGQELPVNNLGRPSVTKKSIADASYAERLFGWRHKTSLKEGLSRILQKNGLII